jgi:hypothetical protein
LTASVAAICLACGCGGGSAPKKNGPAASATSDGASEKSTGEADRKRNGGPARKFRPVELGGSAGRAASEEAPQAASTNEQRSRATIRALAPFQVLLGDWRWITKKKFGDFPKNGDDLHWEWDFLHDRDQPALTATSGTSPYFKQVWLTSLPGNERFRLTIQSDDGSQRVLDGSWANDGEPREESDGKRQQRTYKLVLTQIEPAEDDLWQVALQQLDNNQYLMEVRRKGTSGRQFSLLDTVRQQRVGTSFAVADSDNPGPKCIISGGLGTMTVAYQGKSYPVCCSGCAAAFRDEPERWLTKLAQDEARKVKDE